MSELSNLIFHNASHKITSPYGYRDVINTSKGSTSSFHDGVDYGTYNKKLPQYAIESGEVLSCGTDWLYGGAKYVWVKYPRLGVKMLHYHLDSVKVKKGQAVDENTVLGYTGETGMATGIHLHLGLKLLSGGGYIDPEKWFEENYKAPSAAVTKYEKGDYRVTDASVLNVRSGPGTEFTAKKYKDFTKNARSQIYELVRYKANGYVMGVEFTVSEVSGRWGKTPSGWVCLDYCTKI